MPVINKHPPGLSPYIWHGLDLTYGTNGHAGESRAECPFCGKENKFYVNSETGLFDCKVCGEKGNISSFLQKIHDLGSKLASDNLELTTNRRFLFPNTTKYWGVVQSPLTQEWLIPGYNIDGTITNLYRYVRGTSNKFSVWPTKDIQQGLFGFPFYNPKKPSVMLCEGSWDAMALWEIMSTTREEDDKYVRTSNEGESLFGSCSIIAVPGANVWLPSWNKLLAGKRVYLLFDNDHSRIDAKTNKVIPSTGYEGMRRVVESLTNAEEHPESVFYLNWSNDNRDHNPNLPNGYDVRDFLSYTEIGESADHSARMLNLRALLQLLKPIPGDWTGGEKDGIITKPGDVALKPLPCESYKVFMNAVRKALSVDDGLDRGMSFLCCIIMSTGRIGDQLWGKLIGFPSSAKTTIMEYLATNRKYIKSLSTIRGFHSGYVPLQEGKDTSLINMIKGMTVFIKDGNTLMESPNLKQIFSEMRDIYDGKSRTDYRNGVRNNYENLRVTFAIAGTNAIRDIDHSELGERMLDCIVVKEIVRERERNISLMCARQAFSDLDIEASKGNEIRDNENTLMAKRLASGFVNWLREEAPNLLSIIEVSDEVIETITDYALFIACMRGKPAIKHKAGEGREMTPRLTKQLSRLAKCTAVVLGRKTIDKEVMRRVRHIVLDTSDGNSFLICKRLYEYGHNGINVDEFIGKYDEEEQRIQINFLRKIKVVYCYSLQFGSGHSHIRYRLHDDFYQLYHSVVHGE